MNKDLLASTAVFAEMANANTDLKKIINEFIISIYTIENKLSLDSNEIRNGLVEHYDFDIPEVIIRAQLHQLEKEDIIEKNRGKYTISSEVKSSKNSLLEDLEIKRTHQNQLIGDLVKYVEIRKGKLSDSEKAKLISSFSEYLFETNGDEYSGLVSAFIIKREGDINFTNELNLIREGITILKGIQYSEDFNDFSGWKNELTIYLDTEHLFNILGYNGETYKIMLLDFYNLIRDINGKTINKNGSKIIYLKFLEETEEEIKSFFHMAKKIFKRTKRLVPGKTAMETILEGINLESDITRKESDFFTKLNSMGIVLSDTIDIYDFDKFNIEDSAILEKYKDQKTEDEIVRTLKSFTYINIKRKGRNKEPFERVRHIILTGDYLVRKMSSDFEIKMGNTDFSFATDIFYVTQRLWYKLNRGLGFSSKLPASLDVIRKAQIVISNQLKNHVRERYNKINDDLTKGARTEDQVKDYYLRLRSDNLKPEDITATNIDENIDLIFCKDDLEDYLVKP